MPGWINGIAWCDNVNFDTTMKPTAGIITADGQLMMGAAVPPYIRGGFLTSPDGSLSFTLGAGAIGISSTGSFAQQQIFYVGKHGNDSNSGTNINTAVLTFTQALTLAAAATPPILS